MPEDAIGGERNNTTLIGRDVESFPNRDENIRGIFMLYFIILLVRRRERETNTRIRLPRSSTTVLCRVTIKHFAGRALALRGPRESV